MTTPGTVPFPLNLISPKLLIAYLIGEATGVILTLMYITWFVGCKP